MTTAEAPATTFDSGPPSRRWSASSGANLWFIRKHSGDFLPTLSPEGERVAEVLASMRGAKSIRTVAEELFGAQPSRFSSGEDAHGFVAELAELAERYGS